MTAWRAPTLIWRSDVLDSGGADSVRLVIVAKIRFRTPKSICGDPFLGLKRLIHKGSQLDSKLLLATPPALDSRDCE